MKLDTDTLRTDTETPIAGMQCYAQPLLIHGDCLVEMQKIPDKSVDMILADLPYGTTACKWDVIIPFEPLWKQYERVIKDNGAIVLTGSQPFTSSLVMSNTKLFKYELIWFKDKPTGIGNVNKMPMKYHENICVFYKSLPTYNKLMVERSANGKQRLLDHQRNNYIMAKGKNDGVFLSSSIGNRDSKVYDAELKCPESVIRLNSIRTNGKEYLGHRTQKPITLMEYLILTYTNKGDTVLDNVMGSGTTGIACRNTNRNFIGIEKDDKYFQIAVNRINSHTVQPSLF